MGWGAVEKVEWRTRLVEEEGAQLFSGFVRAWELLLAQALLLLIGAGLRAKPIAWVKVSSVCGHLAAEEGVGRGGGQKSLKKN